jgi:hypothetical protein
MTDRRWLVIVALAGVAMFGLSFVNAWLAHERELRGEGYRWVETMLGAWRTQGMPVLTLAALLALGLGLAALAMARRRGAVPGWLLPAGSVAVLALLLAAAIPIAQEGHASSVRLSLGPLLVVGVVLGAIMVAGSIAVARPSGRFVVALGVAACAIVLAGTAGRWLELQLAEGTGEHWADGSYSRAHVGDHQVETLTIDDGRYRIGDRWAGRWESSGWTVTLDDDPACPESRGAYHVHGEGEADLRFVKVVDTCESGDRAAALEAGIWRREP